MEWFYSMYPAFKHLHFTLIGLSVLLFVLRFVWVLQGSALLRRSWVKVTPHLVDTLLLISGIILCFSIFQYPVTSPWLTEKVLLLVAYIGLGVMAFKSKAKVVSVVAFVAAIGCLTVMAKLAFTKTPLLLG